MTTETHRVPIPCKWCGEDTFMFGTKECDNCHEIRLRLPRINMDILSKMLEEIEFHG